MTESIDYSRFSEYSNKKKRRSIKPVLFLFTVLSVLFIVIRSYSSQRNSSEQKLIKPVSKNVIDTGIAAIKSDENSADLEDLVQKELTGFQGEYSVAIKNLKTGERYYINEHKIFETASLYKLFVMATVIQKIQAGDLSQNDILSQKIDVLNKKFKISSESAELKEGDITLPVNSALSRMITISDNYSALLLTEKVKLSQVSLFLTKASMTETHVGTNGGNPSTSSYDLVQYFEQLYNGKFASKNLTNGMLVLLKNQKINNKLPKYLPISTEISHKTGELNLLSHDAGIVYTPKGDYIIVVLTETNRPLEANEKIAKISKVVYDYFTR